MNDHTPIAADLRLIPLADLALSPLNSRQKVADAEVEAMAESIAIAGLLQNLIGIEDGFGRIEIVGGGKRLRALQKLASEGWSRYPASLKKIDPVPVKITDDIHKAIAWSGAENTARSELHPADEVRAYAAMRERGSSPSMIARSFAKSEAHVERRLRLADLPGPVLDALRANEITYEIAKVLTIAPTEKRCLEALASVRGRETRPDTLRRELTPDTVPLTDRRAAYVTLETYLAAGGTYQQDLFADSAYLHDEKLLNTLFMEKGMADAEAIRAEEGWKWAEFYPESYLGWEITSKLEQLRTVSGELTEADTAEYDDLATQYEANALNAIGIARLEALQARLDGDFSDEDRETGGIFCWVTHHEGFVTRRAFRRREDRPGEQVTDADGLTTTIKPAEDPRDFPQNLRDDLNAIKLRALQTRLMDQPELMLDLLAWSLMGGLLPWSKPLAFRLESPNITPAKTDGTAIGGRLDAVDDSNGDRETSPAEFEAFRALGKKHRNQVLTEALARAFKDIGALAEALANQLDVNTRSIWSPTAPGFLGRTGGRYLDSLWQQLVPASDVDPEHATFHGLKRADKAKRLQALFDDLSVREAMGLDRAQNARIDAWLPQELRWTKPPEGGAA